MQDDLIQRLTQQWIETFGEPPIIADPALMTSLLAETSLSDVE